MPASVRRAILAILVLLAVSGWTATAVLVSSVILPAQANDEVLVNRTRSYLSSYIAVEAAGSRYERVTPYLTGQALADLEAEKSAKPAPVPGLALSGAVNVTVLWRQGNQALLEAVFDLRDEAGVQTHVGEHLLLVLNAGEWDVDSVWRLALDESAAPAPSPSTTPTTTAPAS